MNQMTYAKRMAYLTAAWVIFGVHLILVFIVSLGWLVPDLFYFYLVAFLLTLFSELVLGYCPLTRLEFGLRKKVNPNLVFDNSCIAHYGRALFGLPPRTQVGTKTFFKKYTFLFVLSALFAISILFRFFIFN